MLLKISYIDQNKISLKLSPIFVGELYLCKNLSNPVYIFEDGLFYEAIPKDTTPTRDQIVALIKKNHKDVYLFPEDVASISKNLQNALLKITRSLSVGDPIENGTKDLKLISMNLANLYKNPYDDELLILQIRSAQNLGKFLLEHKKHHSLLFKNLAKENFHFTLMQPMLASVLLLSFLQSTRLFHEKEIENLFLTSYLKDLGMALIPSSKYDLKDLTDKDKKLFSDHSDFSFELLDGRVPLSKNYLEIIKSHHFLNDKVKDILSNSKNSKASNEMLFGIETNLVAIFDMLIAMTSNRPYRKSMSLFQSLEIIKKILADDYPQEFRAIVVFFKQFFKN